MKPLRTLVVLGVLGTSLSFTACTPTQKGATGGAAIGAGAGALIGNQNDNAGEGALIGAAVGGLSGALIGNANEQNRGDGYNHNHGRDYSHSHQGGDRPHTHDGYGSYGY